MLAAPENIHLIARDDWHKVEELARQTCDYVVPEGGCVEEAISGLFTLPQDILQNEKDHTVSFKEILIDAGTGITAATLIAGFGLLKKEAHIHVCLTASTPDDFENVLDFTKLALEKLSGQNINRLPGYTLHKPPTARSFGSTNKTVFSTITRVARQEGVFLDPIYSCKLYLLFEELLEAKALEGPALFIHSGGILSLSGFQHDLQDIKK
jgi:1-aminocyclopropane-1-carboxylate deaminase/D-cysteine desulfhydrase-like pyridoxal-dependent ACC family enzyme